MYRPAILLFSLLAVLLSIVAFRPAEQNCKSLKKGRFHSYSKRTGAHIIITRIDGIQQEVNTSTNDTTYWKIEWLKDCQFAATYLHGAGPSTEEEKRLYQNSIIFFEILQMADNYYIGTTTIKAPNGNSQFMDTTWLTERK